MIIHHPPGTGMRAHAAMRYVGATGLHVGARRKQEYDAKGCSDRVRRVPAMRTRTRSEPGDDRRALRTSPGAVARRAADLVGYWLGCDGRFADADPGIMRWLGSVASETAGPAPGRFKLQAYGNRVAREQGRCAECPGGRDGQGSRAARPAVPAGHADRIPG